MYCACQRTADDTVQQHITFRYNAMKQRLQLTQSRLQEITGLVKVKNPSLLLQLQKASALAAGGGAGGGIASAGSAAGSGMSGGAGTTSGSSASYPSHSNAFGGSANLSSAGRFK